MSSTLAIARHAKAVPSRSTDDHSRALDRRGEADARILGTLITARLGHPQLVLVSDAVRTRQTWDIAAAGVSQPDEVRLEPRIYLAGTDDLLDVVRGAGEVSSALLVGHNPGLHDLVALLAAGGEAGALQRLASGFPTAALAVLELNGPLCDVAPGAGRLRSLDVARAGSR